MSLCGTVTTVFMCVYHVYVGSWILFGVSKSYGLSSLTPKVECLFGRTSVFHDLKSYTSWQYHKASLKEKNLMEEKTNKRIRKELLKIPFKKNPLVI